MYFRMALAHLFHETGAPETPVSPPAPKIVKGSKAQGETK